MCFFFASVDNRTAGKLLIAKYLESYGSKKYDLPYMLEINLTTRKYFKFNNKKPQLAKIKRANKEGISRKLF